jgi:hypothetical protein
MFNIILTTFLLFTSTMAIAEPSESSLTQEESSEYIVTLTQYKKVKVGWFREEKWVVEKTRDFTFGNTLDECNKELERWKADTKSWVTRKVEYGSCHKK